MKIVFISNYYNDHQIPICEQLYKLYKEDFMFVSTTTIDEERLKLGFIDKSSKYPFIIKYDSKNAKEIMFLIDIADVVIFGSGPEKLIEKRIIDNKAVFRYTERILKKGRLSILNPRNLAYFFKYHYKCKDRKVYLLCAGAYTAGDFKLLHLYINKAYKWGYFPKKIEYDIDELIDSKNMKVVNILWAGRLIGWKHPEKAIYAAKELKRHKIAFNLKIIGNGYLEAKLRKLVIKYNLESSVKFLGPMTPEDVRVNMENANIFLFTSDQNEGWGVVLNEAMNSGCAIIAGKKIGSVPYLIKDRFNGIIYENDKDIYRHCIELAKNREMCEMLGKNAYYTIISEWNAEVAIKNFTDLINSVTMNYDITIEVGPCSKDITTL